MLACVLFHVLLTQECFVTPGHHDARDFMTMLRALGLIVSSYLGTSIVLHIASASLQECRNETDPNISDEASSMPTKTMAVSKVSYLVSDDKDALGDAVSDTKNHGAFNQAKDTGDSRHYRYPLSACLRTDL